MDWLWFPIEAVATVGATLTGVYVYLIRPDRQKKKERESMDEEAQRKRNQVIDGIEPVDGMTEGVPPMAVRLQCVETEMKNVVAGQSLLEKRMDEANGTGKRTEAMLILLAQNANVDISHLQTH